MSVETTVNGSCARVNNKQQLTNVKSLNMINCDYSFPFVNDSIVSEKASTRFNQSIVTTNHHRHHQGAAALAARSFRREKVRDGSLKSLSKDVDLTSNNPNTSVSSIISNSDRFRKSQTYFSNSNLNKSLTFPLKPSGKFIDFEKENKLKLFI